MKKSTAVIVTGLFFILLSVIGIRAFAVSPDAQTAIDAVNSLDNQLTAATVPQSEVFVFGPTGLTNVVVNGSISIPSIDCSDPMIPDNLRKTTTGEACFLINYTRP